MKLRENLLKKWLTSMDVGCLHALLNKSSVANFLRPILKSTAGPISSNSTLGIRLPDFFNCTLIKKRDIIRIRKKSKEKIMKLTILKFCRMIKLNKGFILHFKQIILVIANLQNIQIRRLFTVWCDFSICQCQTVKDTVYKKTAWYNKTPEQILD